MLLSKNIIRNTKKTLLLIRINIIFEFTEECIYEKPVKE